MVAHGADFEHRFLRQEFGRLGVVWPSYGNWIIDTKDLSRQFLNTSSVHEALDIAGIFNVRPHSALSDAMATAKFLQWLMQQDFDITCNPQVLCIFPSGLPGPEAEFSRSSGLDTNDQRRLLRLVNTIPRYSTPSLQYYRDILCEAIADRELDAEELDRLRSAARTEEIKDIDIQSLHRKVVRQLTIETILHSVDLPGDLDALKLVASQLDVDSKVIEELVDPIASHPRDFSIELSSGDHIALAGSMVLPREEWLHRAASSGLVVGQVTDKTKMLVASNLQSLGTKAQSARYYDVPIVTESEFAEILSSHVDVDTSPDFPTEGNSSLIEKVRMRRVFPWFNAHEQTLLTPSEIAQAWLDKHSAVNLQEISPYLDSSSTLDIDREGERIMQEIGERFPNVLHVSVNQISQLPGVGVLNLHSIVLSAVLAALDASEQPPDGAPRCDLVSQALSHENAETADASTNQREELDAHAAKVVHAKYRQLSLGLGWIALKNDQIPTADTISLPSEISSSFDEVMHLFQDYPPLLMVFEEAAQELVNAAKDDERKIAIITRHWIGDDDLDSIGLEFGCTQTQMRELETQLRHDFNHNRQFYDAVLTKIERFIGKAIPFHELAERFPYLMSTADPLGTTYGKLFTAIDGFWVIRNGWALSPGFEADILQILEEEKDDYGVACRQDIAARAGISEHLLNQYLFQELRQKVTPFEDYFIIDTHSHSARAVAVLSIVDEPLTIEEIQARLGSIHIGRAREQYAADPRLIQVSDNRWALK